MKDLEILLENKPGSLALLGETLGKNKISLEGGGVFQNGSLSIAHFLMEDAEKAKNVLQSAGIKVLKTNDVLIQKMMYQDNWACSAEGSPMPELIF